MKKILALFMLMFAFMVSASVEAKNSTAPADDIKCSCTKECPVNCDCGCKEGKECSCNKPQAADNNDKASKHFKHHKNTALQNNYKNDNARI